MGAINILFEVLEYWPDNEKLLKSVHLSARKLMDREIKNKPDIAIRAQRYMLELEKIKTINSRKFKSNTLKCSTKSTSSETSKCKSCKMGLFENKISRNKYAK